MLRTQAPRVDLIGVTSLEGDAGERCLREVQRTEPAVHESNIGHGRHAEVRVVDAHSTELDAVELGAAEFESRESPSVDRHGAPGAVGCDQPRRTDATDENITHRGAGESQGVEVDIRNLTLRDSRERAVYLAAKRTHTHAEKVIVTIDRRN